MSINGGSPMTLRKRIQQSANPERVPIFPIDQDAFHRVSVDYLTKGGARIRWEMTHHFVRPAPHTFQLQTTSGNVAEADDWEDVGSPVVNTFYAMDNTRRLYGKTRHISYRIKLTDAANVVYYSKPALTLGQWTKRDWVIAQEILRREQLRAKRYTSVDGYIFKRRRYGTQCPEDNCLDPITGEIMNSNCEVCGGTGIVFGYYDPVAASYADVTNENSREHRDNQSRATVNDVTISGRFFNFPPLVQGDIWVNRFSDERYYIHQVGELASHRGVPIVWNVELRKAEDTDKIYHDPIFNVEDK